MSQGSSTALSGEVPETDSGQPQSNMLYEHAADGAPLVISFGYYRWDEPTAYTFQGRLKKLEAISGRPINKLFVRDPSLRWYLGGVEGSGTDVPSTAHAMRTFIERLSPSSVIGVGQSMGAYGAMLYGTLVGFDKVVAFGPVAAFERRVWDILGETRWLPVLNEIEEAGLGVAPYDNLPGLISASTDPRPDIDLIFGTDPGAAADPLHAVGIDSAHAALFAHTPGVTVVPVHHSQHAVVEYFRVGGVITEVLGHRIFGTSLLPKINELHADQNVAWMLENITMGSTYDQLCEALRPQVTADQLESVVQRTKLLVNLIRLEDTPPVVTA